MRRTIQHAFGSHRSSHHDFGALGNSDQYWLTFPGNTMTLTAQQYAMAVTHANAVHHAINDTPYAKLVSTTNPDIKLNSDQFNAVMYGLTFHQRPVITRTVPSKISQQAASFSLKPVASSSIRSVLPAGNIPVVRGGNPTMTTGVVSTRPRFINVTASDTIPTADQVTSVGQQTIDPAFVQGDHTQPSPSSVPITIPGLPTVTAPKPVQTGGQVLGMSPGTAIAVGIGATAVVLLLLMK